MVKSVQLSGPLKYLDIYKVDWHAVLFIHCSVMTNLYDITSVQTSISSINHSNFDYPQIFSSSAYF